MIRYKGIIFQVYIEGQGFIGDFTNESYAKFIGQESGKQFSIHSSETDVKIFETLEEYGNFLESEIILKIREKLTEQEYKTLYNGIRKDLEFEGRKRNDTV